MKYGKSLLSIAPEPISSTINSGMQIMGGRTFQCLFPQCRSLTALQFVSKRDVYNLYFIPDSASCRLVLEHNAYLAVSHLEITDDARKLIIWWQNSVGKVRGFVVDAYGFQRWIGDASNQAQSAPTLDEWKAYKTVTSAIFMDLQERIQSIRANMKFPMVVLDTISNKCERMLALLPALKDDTVSPKLPSRLA